MATPDVLWEQPVLNVMTGLTPFALGVLGYPVQRRTVRYSCLGSRSCTAMQATWTSRRTGTGLSPLCIGHVGTGNLVIKLSIEP